MTDTTVLKPMTDVSNVHAGEHLMFHAIAPPGALKECLKEGSWKDLPKVLPPSERPGEVPAIHAPWILKRDGLFHMVYGPTPIRYATSKDLINWTPKGSLRGAPSGRDPQIFVWKDIYHLIVCGVHDVRVSTSRDFETWAGHDPLLTMQPGSDPESPSINPGDHDLGGPGALKFTGETNSDIADGKIKPNAPEAQLYDLATDRSQSRNVIREHSKQAELMAKHLTELQRQPRSTPPFSKP